MPPQLGITRCLGRDGLELSKEPVTVLGAGVVAHRTKVAHPEHILVHDVGPKGNDEADVDGVVLAQVTGSHGDVRIVRQLGERHGGWTSWKKSKGSRARSSLSTLHALES